MTIPNTSKENSDRPAVARNALLYMLANHEFFETPDRLPHSGGDYRGLLAQSLPPSWVLIPAGLWYHAVPNTNHLPASGFKIHISSTVSDGRQILQAIVGICVLAAVQFKLLRSSELLALANSKTFPRTAAHKFITVYPSSTGEFVELSIRLASATRAHDGPYILSDHPVPNSKNVFYRFGGFSPSTRLNVDGAKEFFAVQADGKWIPDERLPFFHLPTGVVDPFGRASKSLPTQVILKERYLIKKAIAFSTCGGIYLGVDTRTGVEVVVKEARPHTILSHIAKTQFSAVALLRRELTILNRLSGLSFVPKALDVFEEGGHTFTVQQFMLATPFRRYRAREATILTPFDGRSENETAFIDEFQVIAIQLIRSLRQVHRRQVIVGDISPDNVLVDDARRVVLIDWGTAWDRRWGTKADELATSWMTPGFRRPNGRRARSVTYLDDWFAVAMLLLGMVLPLEPLNALMPGAWLRFVKAVTRAGAMPLGVENVIKALVLGRPKMALTALMTLQSAHAEEVCAKHGERTISADSTGDIEASVIKLTISGVVENLLRNADVKRRDRLWPSDFMIFSTNPLSIAYGAAGPLLFLKIVNADIPDTITNWFLSHKLTHQDYPPGLYVGLSGIAYVLWRLGHQDAAWHAISLANESKLLYAKWGIYAGASGCGWVNLQMYLWTKDQKFADKALEIGERLRASSFTTDRAVYWAGKDGRPLGFGYAHGRSGIALFLLYLGVICENQTFVNLAVRTIDGEIDRTVSPLGKRALRWFSDSESKVWSPYWLSGGCGIGAAVIRFYSVLREEHYLSMARAIAENHYARFSVMPSQFEGLSGIGEYMLDMAAHSTSGLELKRARRIAESIHLYRLAQSPGFMFPGRYLARLSTDYGYGSAGIGLFLSRLITGQERPLHDLEDFSNTVSPQSLGVGTRHKMAARSPSMVPS